MSAELLAEIAALKERIVKMEAALAVLPNFTPLQRRVRAIIVDAAHRWGVSATDIVSDRRTRCFLEPRFAVVWVARQALPYSYPQIGRVLGDRDHTTILHAVRQADRMRRRDHIFRTMTDAMLASVEPFSIPEEAEDAVQAEVTIHG